MKFMFAVTFAGLRFSNDQIKHSNAGCLCFRVRNDRIMGAKQAPVI